MPPTVTQLSSAHAFTRLLALVGLVSALAFAGDRAMAWAGRELLLDSELRFSRLYRGELPARVLVLGNSRGVNALLAPALEERTGRQVRTLTWNGLSAELAGVLWFDWLERHEAPEVLLVEVSFLSVPNHQLGDFRPYYAWSERLSDLARDQAATSWWGCRVARLYCLNSPLTFRAAYYAGRSDQGWVNRYGISPALLAATDTMTPEALNPIRDHDVAALRRVLDSAEAAGTEVRLLWAPYLPAYRDKLHDPDAWRAEAERRLGRPVRDDSRTLTDPALFSDRIHLNDRGAEALADTLVGAGFVGRSDR